MIAVRLMGGLGNQMFQYALGRTLADTHDVPLVLDISHFDNQPALEIPRGFELDCFRIRAEVTREPLAATRSSLRRLIDRKRLRLVEETGFPFDPSIMNADNALLVGYWQTERYFERNGQAIRRDFTPRSGLSERTKAVAAQIDEDTVCLHVRRGEYISHPVASTFHGFLGLDFYRRALALVVGSGVSPRLLVISDEPDWCSEHLDLGYPTTVLDRGEGRDYEDMILMTMCRYLIIANSSFGWWGAWLNDRHDRTVVAPRAWFGNASLDTRDLIPAGWVRL